MSDTTTITLRLSTETKEQLEKLAQATGRSKSFLALEAIRTYLELESWQIAEIQKGLKEADEGDFASESEVESVFSKWSNEH